MPTIKVTKVEFEGRIEEREVIVEEENVSRWETGAELRIVGQPTPRVDGIARVTGQAVYTHDVSPPGMLIGRFLRSPHPHARVRSIDSRKAEALPGVWVVWHRGKLPPVSELGRRAGRAHRRGRAGADRGRVRGAPLCARPGRGHRPGCAPRLCRRRQQRDQPRGAGL
jgi:CO/xanthine dehydrogenase Mo-binding subunit